MNMENCILSAEQVERFNLDGFLVIKDLYDGKDVRAIQLGIYNIIGRVLQRHGLQDERMPFSAESFDDGFKAMIRLDRSLGAEVYDAIKQIPAFIRLLSSTVHEQIMAQLRPGSQAGIAAGGFGIRIDNPDEDHFRAFLHQEYPAQLRSLNGLVFWSPLVPITEEIGPVNFYLGSQKEGPLAVIADSSDTKRKGAYSLKIFNEAAYTEKYPAVSPLSNPGDAVIIDFLLLHSSGVNRSQRSRWTMQFRYFDFSEPTGMAHGWQGSYAAGVDFCSVHPELCKN
jgi:Phytanoyl-CoA dioxygenase (PhyH)